MQIHQIPAGWTDDSEHLDYDEDWAEDDSEG